MISNRLTILTFQLVSFTIVAAVSASSSSLAEPAAPSSASSASKDANDNVKAPSVPQSHIPPSVVMEVRALAREFDNALGGDCAPEKCMSKGCAYADHISVDAPRETSLPGLGNSEQGPGSVAAQEYLTEAVCQFAYEKSVNEKDVRALKRRLEQRLSKAWLKVTVSAEQLEPVPPSLRDSPPDKPPPPPPKPEEPKKDDEKAKEPPPWDAFQAVHELWNTLLPHFAWMIAMVMATMAALMLIWAARRLGAQTIEEKMLAAQLAGGAMPGAPAEKKAAEAEASLDADKLQQQADAARDEAFVKEQERIWTERISGADASDQNAVHALFREWLRTGEYDLLAKAVFVFGDRVSQAISNDADLAMKKMEFAEYLRTVDENDLPPPSDFFRRLNHHAVSSLLLSQDDVQIYRTLVEEFGAHGILRLTESLSPRYGALLLALVPFDAQRGVVNIMQPEFRVALADKLLESTRISREEMAYLFDVLRAARRGADLPAPPKAARDTVIDRGVELDAAGALSVLLSRIDPQSRMALFKRASDRFGGALPGWYENIVYGDMLMRLPEELRNDVLLDVDVKALSGWLSVQDPVWSETFTHMLPNAIRAAIDGNRVTSSSRDQLMAARRGHAELAAALKKQAARGRVSLLGLFG